MNRARIIKNISNKYTLLDEAGNTHLAIPRGKLHLSLTPLVGDLVEFAENEQVTIEKILERKNVLDRPQVANVDQAVIVMSAKEPDFSYSLVDRLIFLISLSGITPVILITKSDLANMEEIEEIYNEYHNAGYKIFISNRLDEKGLFDLFAGKISVLTGQSGVGKSTFLNQIDKNLKIDTQPISKALNRGKHTTRHCQLYPVYGGWLADTPGYSSLDFSRVDSDELKEAIPDFKIAPKCRFLDCKHDKEPGCSIKEYVSKGKISHVRYQNYLAILPLCDKIEKWQK